MRNLIPRSVMKRYSIHAEYQIGERVVGKYISAKKHFALLRDDKVLSWHPNKALATAAARIDAKIETAKYERSLRED